jgi:hypothetical protein
MADPPSTESTIQWLRTLETGGQVTAVFQVLAFGGVVGQADRAFISRDGLLFSPEPVQQMRTGGYSWPISGKIEPPSIAFSAGFSHSDTSNSSSG